MVQLGQYRKERVHMQVQAFEGYWENERFYPLGKPIRKTGRQKAILTFISEPVQEPASDLLYTEEMPEGFTDLVKKVGLEDAQRRVTWLKRLEEAREFAKDEPLPDFPQRSKEMRPPVLLDD